MRKKYTSASFPAPLRPTFGQEVQRLFLKYVSAAIAAAMLIYFSVSAFFYFNELQSRLQISNQASIAALTRAATAQVTAGKVAAAKIAPNISQYALAAPGSKAEQEAEHRLYNLMYDFRRNSGLDCNFYILDGRKQVIATNLFEAVHRKFPEGFTGADIARKAENFSGTYYRENLPVTVQAVPRSLHASLPVERRETDGYAARPGLLLLRFPCGQGELILEPLAGTVIEQVRAAKVDLLLTDRFDNVIFSSDQSATDSIGKARLARQQSGNRIWRHLTTVRSSFTLADTRLQILSYADIAEYAGNLKVGLLLMTILEILLSLLTFFISRRLSQKLTEPIRELNLALHLGGKSGDGDAYHITAETYPEFQTLFNAYNAMAGEIKSLLERNCALAEVKRAMEIKDLEAKFSPHFLFNTLETIRYEIDFDPANAVVMMGCLARLLRYSVNYGLAEVSLSTDMGYIEAYLQLQKMRFDERLDYRIELPTELSNVEIPKLLIQPLVENAITYSIDEVDRVLINISVMVESEYLIIRVEDNGPGIPSAKLAQICSLDIQRDTRPETGWDTSPDIRLAPRADTQQDAETNMRTEPRPETGINTQPDIRPAPGADSRPAPGADSRPASGADTRQDIRPDNVADMRQATSPASAQEKTVHPGKNDGKHLSFGLYNVFKTVDLRYGRRGRVQVNSLPGKGTTVTIYLPLAD